MKSLHCSSFLKTALLIAPLAFYFGGSTVLQAGGKDLLYPGPIRPGNLDYRTELPQGYLEVYSATDEFDDGSLAYHAHSSYAIYTTDGKVFKNVENHISLSDEIPELVSLPVGSYRVVARSLRGGYVRMLVVIKKDQQTILNLDLWDATTQMQLVHN